MLTRLERKQRRALRITFLLWWDIAENNYCMKRQSKYFPLVSLIYENCILCKYFACFALFENSSFPVCPLKRCSIALKEGSFYLWSVNSEIPSLCYLYAMQISDTCYHEYKTKYKGVF